MRRPSNPSKSGFFTQLPWSWECIELSITPDLTLLKEDAVEGVCHTRTAVLKRVAHCHGFQFSPSSAPMLPTFLPQQSCGVASLYVQFVLSFPFPQMHQRWKKEKRKRAKCFRSYPISMYIECTYESPRQTLFDLIHPAFEMSKIKKTVPFTCDCI